jgi:hypothetical protein
MHLVFCNICPAAKQTRQQFTLSSIKSTRSFQLLHVDIWEPYRHITHDGCNFFLIIIDDFTQCTWLFLMRCKSQYISLFATFLVMLLVNFNLLFKSYDLTTPRKCVKALPKIFIFKMIFFTKFSCLCCYLIS